MSSKDAPIPHVEVPDAAAAMKKLEDFGRRVLSVPKHEVEAKDKTTRKPRKRR